MLLSGVFTDCETEPVEPVRLVRPYPDQVSAQRRVLAGKRLVFTRHIIHDRMTSCGAAGPVKKTDCASQVKCAP